MHIFKNNRMLAKLITLAAALFTSASSIVVADDGSGIATIQIGTAFSVYSSLSEPCGSVENPIIIDIYSRLRMDDETIARYVTNAFGHKPGRFSCSNRFNVTALLNGEKFADLVVVEGGAIANTRVTYPLSETVPALPYEQYLDWRLTIGAEDDDTAIEKLEALIAESEFKSEIIKASHELSSIYGNKRYSVKSNTDAKSRQLASEYHDLRVKHLRTAIDAGDCSAMYFYAEIHGMREELLEARGNRIQGYADDIPRLERAFSRGGTEFFQSARLGCAYSIGLLDDLAEVGLVLSEFGIGSASSPTKDDIEYALNERLRMASSTSDLLMSGAYSFPPGHLIQCNPDWCVMAGSTYFRFSEPDTYQCEEIGDGAASCQIVFRLVMRLSVGGATESDLMVDWANSFMSGINKARAARSTVLLNLVNGRWRIVGPLETEPAGP